MESVDIEIKNANLIMGIILEHARVEKRVSNIEKMIELIVSIIEENSNENS